jgi:hypothetical protein
MRAEEEARNSVGNESSWEGEVMVPAEQINNLESWRRLVHKGDTLRCPVPGCKTNAHACKRNKIKVAFYNGVRGFIGHIITCHREVANRLNKIGPCEFRDTTIKASIELTEEPRRDMSTSEQPGRSTFPMPVINQLSQRLCA